MAGADEMTGYVLDTSVIVKWFSSADEADLESALRLRDGIITGSIAITVPDLLYYELANALRYNQNFTCDDVKEAVAAVNDMGFSVRAADPDLLARAVEIAYEFAVTVYDSCFPSLAEAEGLIFVTADYRFFEKLKGAGRIVRLDGLFV
jgi:predicted nucleic acid-binding protein